MKFSSYGLALALGLFAGSVPAHAQGPRPQDGSLVGTIVDEETGTPLTAVGVTLIEAHRSESTHIDGTFAFTAVAAGTYTLSAERIGYRTVRREVVVSEGGVTTVSLKLVPAAIQLSQVVVTGAVGARSDREVLSPTSTVAGAELERRMSETVAATLATEPGLASASIGPATARPVIRGLGGDRILVLEDGLRPGDLSSTSGDHAVAIEPVTARRFEVVRGPMSLLYGSSALGGVVNVVREEVPTIAVDDVHGAVMAQGSSVNSGGVLGGYILGGIGSFALRGEASYRASGEVQTPAGPLLNTQTRTMNLAGGGALVGNWGHAGLAYRLYDNDYGIPGGFVGGHEGGVDIQMRRHMLRGQYGLHSDKTFFSSIDGDAAYTNYEHVELERSGRVGTRFQQDLVSLEATARHAQHGPFAQGAVGARAQYRDIQTGGSLRTPSTYDYTLAVFGVEEFGEDALRVQLGARYDVARYVPRDTTAFVVAGGERIPVRERSFGAVSGSAGLLYALTEEVRAGASLSRAYRTPDFNELYSNGPHLAANSFDVGDPSLSDETGLGIDAFLRYGSDIVKAEVAAFYNQLDDYVFPSSRGRAEQGIQGGRPRFQYTNEDATFRGFEGDFEWNPIRRVVLTGTLSHVVAEFTSDREPIPVFDGLDTTFVAASQYPPLIPPMHGNLGVRYDHRRYFAGGEVRWAAEQDRLGDFETATEGHAIGNLTAGVRLIRGAVFHTLTLKIDNVLNQHYREHLSRVKEIMPEPGRNISLLYRMTF